MIDIDRIPFMTTLFTISSIWRYPVKGLGGECLQTADVLAGRGFANDRRWLLVRKNPDEMLSGKQPWRPWNYALTLKFYPQLAALHAAFADDVLTISTADSQICGNVNTPDDMQKITEFLREFLQNDEIVLLDCKTKSIWDEQDVVLTVLFSESVTEFAQQLQMPLETQRFRANIVLDGGNAWDERNMKDDTLSCYSVRLTVGDGVERCPATMVNPKTFVRDAEIPEMLIRLYNKNIMGIKCNAICGGTIAIGDEVRYEK